MKLPRHSDLVADRWPHYSDDALDNWCGKPSLDELRRVALETQLDDKLLVRKHIERLSEPLPKLLFSGPIGRADPNSLPPSYVVKTRCQSGKTCIIEKGHDALTGAKICWKDIVEFFEKQWSHRGLNNNVIIEDLVRNEDGTLCTNQLKCHVFNGRVKYIILPDDSRDSKIGAYTFTREWERVCIFDGCVEHAINKTVPPPKKLSESISLAEKLAAYYHGWCGISHVRVDIYLSGNGPIFCEFSGGGDGGRYLKEAEQYTMGNLW